MLVEFYNKEDARTHALTHSLNRSSHTPLHIALTCHTHIAGHALRQLSEGRFSAAGGGVSVPLAALGHMAALALR